MLARMSKEVSVSGTLQCLILAIVFFSVATPVVARNNTLAPLTNAQKNNPRFIESSIRVNKFRLRGFTAMPRLGITEKNVHLALQQWLKEDRGLATFESLQNIADKLTGFYRESGLTFHRAILPPQEVKRQTVTIRIITGKLADVQVRGQKNYSARQLNKSFKGLINHPVVKGDIEEALLLLNDSPGIETFAYFSKAKGRGRTRVNVKVTQEKNWQGSLRTDNYGSDSTGLYRTTARLSWLNPSGAADQLDLGVMQSIEPENNTYGSLSYNIPFFSPRFILSMRLSNNSFDVGDGFESLKLSGDNKNSHMELSYKARRSYEGDRTFGLYLDNKVSTIGSEVISGLLDDEEKTVAAGIYWRTSSSFFSNQIAQSTSIDLYSGQYDSQLNNINQQSFNKTSVSYNLVLRILQSQSWLANSLSVAVRGQYSAEKLPSFEQFALSGPFAVRAVESGFFSADRGAIATAQWYWQLPRNSYLSIRPYVFMDRAVGEQLDSQSSISNKSDIQGQGFGVDVQILSSVNLKLIWARSSFIKQGIKLDQESDAQSSFLAEISVPFN